MKINKSASFTLLEVMIFVMILSVVLVTATSYITRLLVNLRANEHRTNAVFLADDLKEWLNGEREANTWAVFAGEGTAAGSTYCVNQLLNLNNTIVQLGPPTNVIPAGNCTTNASVHPGLPPIYRRQLVLQTNASVPPTQVTARITVSWVENGVAKSVTTQSIYTSPF